MFLLIRAPILLSAPILIIYFNIRVRVRRINRVSSPSNCSQTKGNATLQKQWSSSDFLSYYVHSRLHVSAQILQTNDLFFKFSGDCSAGN